MNKLLLAAALTMVGASAFASKARVGSLLGARTTTSDFQQIFEEPSRIGDVPDQATIEFGDTKTYETLNSTPAPAAANGTPNAEGGFLRSTGEYRYGAYLGHQNRSMLYMITGDDGTGTVSPLIRNANGVGNGKSVLGSGARYAENPLSLFFGGRHGDIRYGLNLYYANSERQTAVSGGTTQGSIKKQAGGLAIGAKTDVWDSYAVVGLLGKFEDNSLAADATTAGKFNGGLALRIGGGYNFEKAYAYAFVTSLKGKTDSTNGTNILDLDSNAASVGVEQKIKSDLVHFYYGARVDYGVEKNNVGNAPINKLEALYLPVYMGLEADAASWLTLRASITQKVLLATTKISGSSNASLVTSSDGTDTLIDSTTVATGASFKFNKLSIDTLLAAGTTTNPTIPAAGSNQTSGTLSTVNFGTTTSLTYTF